jgi:hypothetical protein
VPKAGQRFAGLPRLRGRGGRRRDIETILEFSPAAVEGIDEAIVDTMRLPRRGPTPSLAFRRARPGSMWTSTVTIPPKSSPKPTGCWFGQENGRLVAGRPCPTRWSGPRCGGSAKTARAVLPPVQRRRVLAGWEDSAVAPENLAAYLSDFRGLLDSYGLQGVMYGHFGAGCMHIRITYDLRSDEGRSVFRKFGRRRAAGGAARRLALRRARRRPRPVEAAAAHVFAAHAGGVRRLPQAVGPGRHPEPRLHHGPDPMDENLALDGVPQREWRTSFDLRRCTPAGGSGDGNPAHGADPWVHAVQGCIGVGRCRSDAGGVMCPSYRATGDEKDSTRGRSRVLQDMVRGRAPSRRAGSPRRSGRCWTSAWPARPAPATAPPAWTWPATSPSSSTTTTRERCGRCRTSPWAGCRAG